MRIKKVYKIFTEENGSCVVFITDRVTNQKVSYRTSSFENAVTSMQKIYPPEVAISKEMAEDLA